jgi:hypothetical protein
MVFDTQTRLTSAVAELRELVVRHIIQHNLRYIEN